jgi:polyferredoxin
LLLDYIRSSFSSHHICVVEKLLRVLLHLLPESLPLLVMKHTIYYFADAVDLIGDLTMGAGLQIPMVQLRQ